MGASAAFLHVLRMKVGGSVHACVCVCVCVCERERERERERKVDTWVFAT